MHQPVADDLEVQVPSPSVENRLFYRAGGALIVTVLALIAALPLLFPLRGSYGMDLAGHISNAHALAESWPWFPHTTPALGSGTSLLKAYGSVAHLWIATASHVVGLFWAYRTYLIACLLVLAWGGSLLVWKWTGRPIASVATGPTLAAGYVISFPVGLCAEFAHLATYALVPWLLMCLTPQRRSPTENVRVSGARVFLGVGLLCLMTFANPPAALRCALSVTAVITALAVTDSTGWRTAVAAGLTSLGMMVAVGAATFLLTAFRTLPSLAIMRDVEYPPGRGTWSLDLPVSWVDFFSRRLHFPPFQKSNEYQLPYLGLATAVLIVMALPSAFFWRRRPHVRPYLVVTAVAIVWALAYLWPELWQRVPLAGVDGAAFRTGYLTVYLGILAGGLAVAHLEALDRAWWSALIIICGLGYCDLVLLRRDLLEGFCDLEQLPQATAWVEARKVTQPRFRIVPAASGWNVSHLAWAYTRKSTVETFQMPETNSHYERFVTPVIVGLRTDPAYQRALPHVMGLLGADCVLVDSIGDGATLETQIPGILAQSGLRILTEGLIPTAGNHTVNYRYFVLGGVSASWGHVSRRTIGFRGSKDDLLTVFLRNLLDGFLDPISTTLVPLGPRESPEGLDEIVDSPSRLEESIRRPDPPMRASAQVDVRWTDEDNDTILVNLALPTSRATWVAIARQYYPSFVARTDEGLIVPTRPIHGGLMGVMIPGGSRSVRITYEERPWIVDLRGMSVGLWTMGGLSLVWLWVRRRSSRG